MTPASVNNTNLLPYYTVYSRNTEQPIEKVFADKGYAGKPKRHFLFLNEIVDGTMRKIRRLPSSTNMKKNKTEKFQGSDISSNNTSVSDTFTIKLKWISLLLPPRFSKVSRG
jgi:hypothetical protein